MEKLLIYTQTNTSFNRMFSNFVCNVPAHQSIIIQSDKQWLVS